MLHPLTAIAAGVVLWMGLADERDVIVREQQVGEVGTVPACRMEFRRLLAKLPMPPAGQRVVFKCEEWRRP